MERSLLFNRAVVLSFACILSSCASISDTDSQGKPAEAKFLGQLFLAEVSYILTKDQIILGELGYGRVKNLYSSLQREGLTDAEIDAGQVIAIRSAIYWNNTASGITHDQFAVALLPKEMKVDPGNIVEIKHLGPSHFPRVENIRARNMRDGQCRYSQMRDPLPLQLTKEILGLISLVGPSGTVTLYCNGIEKEGWEIEGGQWTKKAIPSTTLAPSQ
jgi:hypothetical protein